MNSEAKRPLNVLAEIGIEVVIGALLLASSFRSISIPLLFLYAALRLIWRQRRMGVVMCVGLLFILSIFQPIDISLSNTRYTRFGTPGRGLHLVPVFFGLQNGAYLREHYKEYVCGGCCSPVVEPKWVLMWN